MTDSRYPLQEESPNLFGIFFLGLIVWDVESRRVGGSFSLALLICDLLGCNRMKYAVIY